MPKPKNETILSDDGTTRSVQVEVTERKAKKTATYAVPSNAVKFQEMVLGLSDKPDAGAFSQSVLPDPDRKYNDESPLAFAYRMWTTQIDRYARQSVYTSLAAESTTITVGGNKIDVMTFPLVKLVRAINGYRAQVDVRIMAGTVGVDESTPEGAAKVEQARKDAEDSIGYGPWRTAARYLTDGYTDSDDKVHEAQAKENPATGLLEVL